MRLIVMGPSQLRGPFALRLDERSRVHVSICATQGPQTLAILIVETLRNMQQIGERPGAWSVDRARTRAYHSKSRVLWAGADAP